MKQLVDYEKIEALSRRLERIMEEFMSLKNELLQNLPQKRNTNDELNYLLNSTIDFMDGIHDVLRRKPQVAKAQQKRSERRKTNVGK